MVIAALVARSALPNESQVIVSLMFFITGIYFAFPGKSDRTEKPLIFFTVIFFFSALSSMIMMLPILYPTHAFRLPYNMHFILFTVSLVTALYMFSISITLLYEWRPINCLGKSIKWFGDNSYAIFLIHWGLIFPIISYIPNRLAGIACYLIIMSVASYVLTKLSCMLTQQFTKKAYGNA